MDFNSLPRRDLQFFCKKNKIPANMTNIAMADALKALEIVQGMDEFVNQSESTLDQSPTSVAKNLPSAARTAARTTRRKTKDETQPSDLVTRSCLVTSKSLAGELEQENRNTNVLQNPSLPQSRRRAAVTPVAMNLEGIDMKAETNVTKTPAARSTRRAQAAASSKKDESVQRVYSTRRSFRLLEESMADLSLKTKESLNVPSKKNEDPESESSPADSKFKEKSYDNSEKAEVAEVISVRELNDSLEKEWDGLKNDPDLDILYGDLGDITFFDATTSKEQMNGTESNTVPASESFVLVEEQETSQEDNFVVVDHAASTTTNIVTFSKESKSEKMKNDSESESEDDDSGGVFDTNQEVFESKVSASDNVTKVASVPTVLLAEESKELESEYDSEESCESDELMDNRSEVAIVSDKKKPQTSSLLAGNSDEWSDYEIDIDISDMEENSCEYEEMIDFGSEESSVSDKKTPAASSTLAGKETKTPLKSPFETESKETALKPNLLTDNNNKENVEEEMVLNNDGEKKTEAEAKKKKKTIDEESLKDVSMRQLTKMVKELAIKSKQQHKCLE